MTNEIVNGIPTTVYSGKLHIDTDLEGSKDLEFYSFYGMGHPLGFVVPYEGCQVSSHSTDKQIEIFMSPKHLNDTIDNKHFWTKITLATFLSRHIPESANSPELISNFWNTEGLYMGFRVIQSKDTSYGWTDMQIDDYYKLKIKEVGIQK